MLRSSIAVCVIAAPLAAQQVVLVELPPVYKSGESARGIIVDQTGTRMLGVEQHAERGSDGQLYLLASIVDENGMVQGRIIFDPRTYMNQVVSEEGNSRTIATTCSPKGLYPITLGKVYECTNIIQRDDRVVTSHSRREFNSVERTQEGHIAGFCSIGVDDDGEAKITVRVCSTPDGKWMRTMQFLEIIKITKT